MLNRKRAPLKKINRRPSTRSERGIIYGNKDFDQSFAISFPLNNIIIPYSDDDEFIFNTIKGDTSHPFQLTVINNSSTLKEFISLLKEKEEIGIILCINVITLTYLMEFNKEYEKINTAFKRSISKICNSLKIDSSHSVNVNKENVKIIREELSRIDWTRVNNEL